MSVVLDEVVLGSPLAFPCTPVSPACGSCRFVVIDGQSSNKMPFTFSPPTITSLTPAVVPTTGYVGAELVGDSFGNCLGVPQCYLKVQVTFPSYSILLDLSDKVGPGASQVFPFVRRCSIPCPCCCRPLG